MALAIDGTTPAAVTATGLTVTTGSFTPPARSVLLALCSIGNSTGGAPTATGAITDSISSPWRLLDRYNPTANEGSVELWGLSIGDSPSARTVTLTGSGTNGKGVVLWVGVFTGSAPRDEIIGAKQAHNSSATLDSLTTKFNGSYVLTALADPGLGGAFSCDGTTNTLLVSFDDTGNGEHNGLCRSTNTLSAGSFTPGFNGGTASVQCVFSSWEIRAALDVNDRTQMYDGERSI
jgi:hypothetical protein